MFRHIIHLHIPAFPVAVERVLKPDLRSRPVVVAPVHSERALIFSASREALREGVFKGMPLGKALRFCPGLIVLSPNPELMERAWRGLSRIVARYTPLWEPLRPGHVYLDVTGTERLWGRAKDTAICLRKEIKGYLCLPGTVGVAGNKMVSSIASRVIPSEGVLDVDHGRECSFIAPMKVDVLPGIGPVRRRMLLEELNISLVREVAAMDLGRLKLIFGREGYVIHQRALGIDPTPVYPPPMDPTVSEEIILPGDENDDRILLGILYGLVEKCSHRLRRRALLPGRAGLRLRYADQEEIIRQVPLPHRSFWDSDLYRPLEDLFFRICRRRVRIRFMRVWFRDFSPPSPQLSLFSSGSANTGKKMGVTLALDRIREKHGEAAIKYGRAA